MKSLFFALPIILALGVPGTSAQAQEERWITVKILQVEEGIPDSRNKPSFRVTVEVQMAGCSRATLKMTSSANVDGKNRSWVSNDSFSAPGPGRIKQQVQLLVSESSLRSPPAGAPIEFAVTARGYYTVREMRQVEYIDYVPVEHQTPGYIAPGGGGFHFD